MPLYEYQCESCSHRFERIQKFSDPPIEICPSCGGPVKKLLSSPAIQFKGSGWYITDYAKKPSGDSAKSGASKDTSSETPAEKGAPSTSKDTPSSKDTSSSSTSSSTKTE